MAFRGPGEFVVVITIRYIFIMWLFLCGFRLIFSGGHISLEVFGSISGVNNLKAWIHCGSGVGHTTDVLRAFYLLKRNRKRPRRNNVFWCGGPGTDCGPVTNYTDAVNMCFQRRCLFGIFPGLRRSWMGWSSLDCIKLVWSTWLAGLPLE